MSDLKMFDRRQLLQTSLMAGIAGLGATALGGLGNSALAQSATKLRMYWWGSKERAEVTNRTNAAYLAKNPDVAIEGETLGWSDYWPRLATQAAGRNMPDIVQMDYGYIYEYARRGGLLPLDKYLPSILKIADFGQSAIDSGRVDGKLYGVSLGLNSSTVFYAPDVFDKAGMLALDETTSWADFAKLAAELTKAIRKDGVYASADAGGLEPVFEGWLRTRGQSLYTVEGTLGFKESDIGEWFAMWDAMRKSKACVPADAQALDKETPEASMLSLGKSVIAFGHSNQLIAYQAINPLKLAMAMYPTGGPDAKPAHYLKPAMMWSIAATSKNPEAAAKVINFFVADPDGAKALGVERGVPASASMREVVAPQISDLAREMVTYISFISDKVGPLPPPPPKGAGEIRNLLHRTNEVVGFGKASIADGAKSYIAEAQSILERG